jgi:hypothetical protein
MCVENLGVFVTTRNQVDRKIAEKIQSFMSEDINSKSAIIYVHDDNQRCFVDYQPFYFGVATTPD